MKIAHVALWTRDIDAQLAFWQRYFNGEAGEEYVSRNRPGFVSRFVSLAAGPTLEIMRVPTLLPAQALEERVGWAHIALSLGDERQVDRLAQRAQQEGILQPLRAGPATASMRPSSAIRTATRSKLPPNHSSSMLANCSPR